MASIDNIVSVIINSETSFPTVRDLKTVAVLSEHTRFSETYRIYEYPTASADMLVDGFTTSDYAYKAVDLLFKQDVKPKKVIVGKKLVADSYTTAINKLNAETSQWFYLNTDADSDAEILEVAGVIEGMERLHVFTSSSADTINNVAGNIFADIESLSYRHTHYAYHSNPDSTVPAMAILGRFSPEPEGSITWRMKTLRGIPSDNLTTTQENNLKLLNASWYTTIEGVDVYFGDAKVSSGEYVDVIVGNAWVKSRMQERIFGTLLNNRKINMDNGGAAKIQSDVQATLTEAVERNIYASTPAPYVKIPNVLALSPAQRNSRVLPSVEFRARLAGAIQETDVVGSVYP